MNNTDHDLPLTATHWGTYRAVVRDGRLTALHGFEEDLDPSPIAHGMLDTLDDPCRIAEPMVRKGWLERGAGSDRSRRGAEPFVAVAWDEASRLVARELERVIREHGNRAIFAGSYGWASAGKFHHAPSQLGRFLNCIGGFTYKRDSYSLAAGQVILPHILGDLFLLLGIHTGWPSIIEHTELLVAFGGLPVKNGQVGNYRDQGCDFLAFGPKGALLEALEEDDTGYILSIDPDMDERYLRTIEDLPVDAVLLSMKSVEPPLTVQDLITISSVRGNFSKYLLLEVTGGFSANELEGLRGIGVDALVVEATTLSAKKLQELRDALLALPKRQRSRSPRASAVLPRGSFVLPGASAGEEEYDDDDEYDE